MRDYPGNFGYATNIGLSTMKMGEVHLINKDYQEALQYYTDSNSIFEELCKNYPQDETAKNYLAESFLQIGMIYQISNQFEIAKKCFTDYYNISKGLFENNPHIPEYKKNIALSHNQLSEIYLLMNEHKLAVEHFIKRSEVLKELCDNYPQNITYQKELYSSYERLTNYYRDNREAKDVLPFSTLKNELAIEIFAANKNNSDSFNALGLSHYELGKDLFALQNFEDAKVHFAKAVDIFEQLFEFTKKEEYSQKRDESRYMLDFFQNLDP